MIVWSGRLGLRAWWRSAAAMLTTSASRKMMMAQSIGGEASVRVGSGRTAHGNMGSRRRPAQQVQATSVPSWAGFLWDMSLNQIIASATGQCGSPARSATRFTRVDCDAVYLHVPSCSR